MFPTARGGAGRRQTNALFRRGIRAGVISGRGRGRGGGNYAGADHS